MTQDEVCQQGNAGLQADTVNCSQIILAKGQHWLYAEQHEAIHSGGEGCSPGASI